MAEQKPNTSGNGPDPDLERRVEVIMESAASPTSLPTAPSPEKSPPAEKLLPAGPKAPLPLPAMKPPANPSLPLSKLDDALSDAAVDAILATESDAVLKAADAEAIAPTALKPPHHGWRRLLKRKLFWLGVLLCLLILVIAIPPTRYKLAGIFIKKTYSFTVVDSKTDTPVSAAAVRLDGRIVKTNARGIAKLNLPVGYASLQISKQYYQSLSRRLTIGILGSSANLTLRLMATGRQVPLTLVNRLSGQPIAGATISAVGTTAKIDTAGRATIALPTKANSYTATISAPGYNTLTTAITVTPTLVASNDFRITPAGRVYFLSSPSGTINVMSANLDGSAAKVVLAGTGQETNANTRLFNSADWRYLVLSTQRSDIPNENGLYLINTSENNQLVTIDQGQADFTPIGWYQHYFIYEEDMLNTPDYQGGKYLLKSYDADSGHLITLDQSQASGSSETNYAEQGFTDLYIVDGKLIYTKIWNEMPGFSGQSTLYTSINSIDPAGQNQTPLQQFSDTPSSTVTSVLAAQYAIDKLYFEVTTSNINTPTFYDYSGGSLTSTTLTPSSFAAISYTPEFLSPSGTLIATTATRNGQLVLLSGAAGATSQQTVATLSGGYSFYGWYSDNYILVAYQHSSLRIVPVSGLKSGMVPGIIGNYYSGDQ